MRTSDLRLALAAIVLLASPCFAQTDAFQPEIAAADVAAMKRGRDERLKGHYDKALQILGPLASHQPNYFNAQYELGLTLASRGSSTEEGIPALKAAAQLKQSNPAIRDAHVYNSLGWALMFAQRPKEAEAAFKEGERHIDQMDADTRKRLYNNMGYLYLTQGKLKDSERYLKLAADGGSEAAKKNLRTVEYMQKKN